MNYGVIPPESKRVYWNINYCEKEYPTLAEIIEAAKKEFPEITFEQLIITTDSCEDSEVFMELK